MFHLIAQVLPGVQAGTKIVINLTLQSHYGGADVGRTLVGLP